MVMRYKPEVLMAGTVKIPHGKSHSIGMLILVSLPTMIIKPYLISICSFNWIG